MNLVTAPETAGESTRPEIRRIPRSPAIRTLIAALCLAGGAALGVWGDRALTVHKTGAPGEEIPRDGAALRPGPWGELYAAPFTISAPEEVLPVRAVEEGGTRWILTGSTRDEFKQLLREADASPEEMQALLDGSVLHEKEGVIELTPPAELIISLGSKTRQAIYQAALARLEENRSQVICFPKDALHERFDGSGVADSTIRLFKQLCWENGDHLVFSGMSAILSRLPTYSEKLTFMKALSRQKTLLLQLHIKPGEDLDALAKYWGRGCWSNDIRTVFDSVAQTTGGTWINVLMVLPPIPASELYFYPVVQDNPLNGPPVTRDCHWSSLNFFREAPDPNCAQPGYVSAQFQSGYYEIYADPRYGDVLMLATPDGTVVHSGVYIADDIIFTKNGSTALYPWMFSTVSDLKKQYGYKVSSSEKLVARYYRNKSL